MRIAKLILALCFASIPLFAQGTGGFPAINVRSFVTDPSPCLDGWIWYNTTTNQYKICPSGTATVIGTGSGSGANVTLSNLTSPTAVNEPLNFSAATNAGSGYLNLGFPGTNATGQNGFEFLDQSSASGNMFGLSFVSNTFNAVVDNVACFGWNQRKCGQVSTSWGSLWLQLEGGYVPSSPPGVVEWHHIIADTTGAQHRWLTCQFAVSNGVDQFCDLNLNGGLGIGCLVATGSPCSTIGTGVSYAQFTPTQACVGCGFSGATNIPLMVSGNVTANASANSGGGLILGATSYHLSSTSVPGTCTSLAYEITYWGTAGDSHCAVSYTGVPQPLGYYAVQNIGSSVSGGPQANSGFYGNSHSGTGPDTWYRGASSAGNNGGIGITFSYTSDSNNSSFMCSPFASSSATGYCIGYQTGSGGANPLTTLIMGAWSGVTLQIADGSTNMITGDGSGDPNLLNTVKYHGTSGVSVSGILCTATFTTVAGGVTACTATSDPRLKNIFGHYERGLPDILKLYDATIRFNFNAEGLRVNNIADDAPNPEQQGFNAAAVEAVMPEAVSRDKEGWKTLPQGDRPIVAALVNSVHDLQAEIKSLEAEVEKLKAGK